MPANCTPCAPCCCVCNGNCICNCCPNLIPAVLHGTITNVTNCDCLPANCTFIWNGTLWLADIDSTCDGPGGVPQHRWLAIVCVTDTPPTFQLYGSLDAGVSANWFGQGAVNILDSCCPIHMHRDVVPDIILGPGSTCNKEDVSEFTIVITA